MLMLIKRSFLIALIAYFTLPAALGEESDVNLPQLEFIKGQMGRPWITGWRRAGGRGRLNYEYGGGPLRPTHVAELFVWNNNTDFTNFQWRMAILATEEGQSLSREQKELLKTGNAICLTGPPGENVGDHDQFGLYGTSEDDARKLTEAFLCALQAQVTKNRENLGNKQHYASARLEKCREDLVSRKKELEELTARFDEPHSQVGFSSAVEAEDRIKEFNNTLGSLEIAIAGQKAKVAVIQEYLASKKINNPATIAKLEDTLSTCAIELADALAQKEAIITLRDRAKLYTRIQNLPKEIRELEVDLRNWEKELQSFDIAMNYPDMQPAQIFQNTVTIYPVTPDPRDDPSESGASGTPASPKENNSSS